MGVDNVNKAIDRTLRNTVHREIGCFTDEVNKAEKIYFLTTVSSKRIATFFDSIKALPLSENRSDITDRDLLIVFDSELNGNSRFYDLAASFKNSSGHVAGIVVDRKLDYIAYVDELLGININQADIEKYEVDQIFGKTVDVLLDEVDKKVLHFEAK
ncbi:hypothetical protein C7H83_04855 [Tetragenococcus halophilus]|uniref:Uncharacterized protein n=2 Tax=Tetragenococcus halophilus TaxID=51669 RepID=A0A2H6CQM8_TETHA|nr:hypothetical protein [Tetragenococcus halophilus]MDN6270319.1 hypothetical protein [Tetragenococcus koreensis]AOF48399.1 hypothetical protein AC806_02705 [Tetragenococcus halophilus]AYW49854.1 hypothetical protein C7H83_04855 [Tetragenococcus halophilus]MCF1601421.1 hypothetical protein [Tetragenococcus halophilus]MCO8287786.1 hypothetical protein [Tetragenococcus halophilus]